MKDGTCYFKDNIDHIIITSVQCETIDLDKY